MNSEKSVLKIIHHSYRSGLKVWSDFRARNQSSHLWLRVTGQSNGGGQEHWPAHSKTQFSDVCCSDAANSTRMHSSLSCALSIKHGCQRRGREERRGRKDGEIAGVLQYSACSWRTSVSWSDCLPWSSCDAGVEAVSMRFHHHHPSRRIAVSRVCRAIPQNPLFSFLP